jgi:hypothetical protein
MKSRIPVWEEFVPRFQATLELGVCAMIFATAVGIPVGVLAAVKRGSIFDHTAVGLALTGYSPRQLGGPGQPSFADLRHADDADAVGLADNDAITLSYSYADQVVIEALTTKAPELTFRFAGLNEADSGKPVIFDLYRVSQGVAKQLSLIKKGFGALDIEGEVLQDPTKTGVGISRYMRTIHV